MNTGRKRDISRPVEHMRPEELGIGELFGRIREAVIVADATTQRIVLWNPAATNIFGYSISEALELNIEKLVPEPLKAQHREGITRYAQTGHGPYIDSSRLLELPALTKSGQEIYVELSLSPIRLVDDTNGGRRFVLAIVRDVTERKRAEEALRQNEERFRLLVECHTRSLRSLIEILRLSRTCWYPVERLFTEVRGNWNSRKFSSARYCLRKSTGLCSVVTLLGSALHNAQA